MGNKMIELLCCVLCVGCVCDLCIDRRIDVFMYSPRLGPSDVFICLSTKTRTMGAHGVKESSCWDDA
jgi:hypothetical protein